MNKLFKHFQRKKRQQRIRQKIKGTKKRPRLSIFRSNKYIYLQLIDDEKRITLVSADDREVKKKKDKLSKKEAAFKTGRLLAERALKKKIKNIVFDRGGYKYHGRVKSVADGARERGLRF